MYQDYTYITRAHEDYTKSHFSTTASCNISFSQAQQGRPQTQFLFGVVPSLVVFSQHRLFSSLMVQALQVESSLQRLAQSRRPSDLRARPPLVLRPPLMYVPSVISQPGQVKSLHTRKFLNIRISPPFGPQGNPHTHLRLGVVPSLVVLSQQRLLSFRMVHASQVRSS